MTKQVKTITLQDGTQVTTTVKVCKPSNKGRRKQQGRVRTNMAENWRIFEIQSS